LLRKLAAFAIALALSTFGITPAAQAVPIEPAYRAINVNSMWNNNIRGQGVSIAMIDQGVNLQHPYFTGQVADGFCFYQPTTNARCPNGTRSQVGIAAASQRRDNNGALIALESHGNMVAGLVAGKPNSQAPGGLAPQAKIVMANTDMQPDSVVRALEFFYANRVKYNIVAISMSFGILGLTSRQDLLNCNTNPVYNQVRASLRKLRDAGVIPFAAAGNGYYLNSVESWAPTCLDEAVSVGSVNSAGLISIYNTMSTKVELLAPDYAISAVTNGYQRASGTSAAAPMAAASFALLRQQFPNRSGEEVLEAMKASGKKLDDVVRKQIPMVDLAAAQQMLSAPPVVTPPVTSSPTTTNSNTVSPTPTPTPTPTPSPSPTSSPVAPTPTLPEATRQQITVGTFNGFIAIYVKGYESRHFAAKIAGKWTMHTVLKNSPGKDYALIRRNTGAGFDVKVEVWIDGAKQSLIVGGSNVGTTATVRTR